MHKYIGIALKIVIFACFAFFIAKYTLYKQAVVKQKFNTILTNTQTINNTKEES